MRCKRKISVVTWMHLSTILWVRPSDFFLALLILLKKPDEVNTFGFPLSHSQHRSSPGSKIQATASLLSYPVQHRVRQEPAPSALNSRAPSTGKRTFIPQKCWDKLRWRGKRPSIPKDFAKQVWCFLPFRALFSDPVSEFYVSFFPLLYWLSLLWISDLYDTPIPCLCCWAQQQHQANPILIHNLLRFLMPVILNMHKCDRRTSSRVYWNLKSFLLPARLLQPSFTAILCTASKSYIFQSQGWHKKANTCSSVIQHHTLDL